MWHKQKKSDRKKGKRMANMKSCRVFGNGFHFSFFSWCLLEFNANVHTHARTPKSHIFSRKMVKIYVITFVGSTITHKNMKAWNMHIKKWKPSAMNWIFQLCILLQTLFFISYHIMMRCCFFVCEISWFSCLEWKSFITRFEHKYVCVVSCFFALDVHVIFGQRFPIFLNNLYRIIQIFNSLSPKRTKIEQANESTTIKLEVYVISFRKFCIDNGLQYTIGIQFRFFCRDIYNVLS